MIQQIHNDRCEFCQEREALYVIPGPAGVMKACAPCKDRRQGILKKASWPNGLNGPSGLNGLNWRHS